MNNSSSSAVTFNGDLDVVNGREVSFDGGNNGGRFVDNTLDDFNNISLQNGAVWELQRSGSTDTYRSFRSTAGTQVTGLAGTNLNIEGEGNGSSYSNSQLDGSISGSLNFIAGLTGGSAGGYVILNGSGANASNYTGTTTVGSAVLEINGSHTGGGNYTISGRTDVSSGGHGYLTGTGSIDIGANTFTISGDADTQAVVGPGSGQNYASGGHGAIGTLTLTGSSVIFGDYGYLAIDLLGSSSDLLAINGNLDLSSGTDFLVLNDLGAAWDGSIYTIATFTGSLTGTFDNVSGLGAGYSVVYGANSISLSSVPEPRHFALALGVSALALLSFRRLRRKC